MSYLKFLFILNIFQNVKSTSFQNFKLKKGEKSPILISFNPENYSANSILDKLRNETNNFKNYDRGSKITTIQSELNKLRVQSQVEVLNFLTQENIYHRSYWISNQIYIPEAENELIQHLYKFENIQKIEKDLIFSIEEPGYEIQESEKINEVEWNIGLIEADKVWNETMGEGVVVGVLDSGVRMTHEALRHNYVGAENHGWYDPLDFSEEPMDINGHGTHCQGILGGLNGIGVAPQIKWMHCRICRHTTQCYLHALMECGQFMFCPTDWEGQNTDCSKAPRIASNSWGTIDVDIDFYRIVLEMWTAADIIGVFAQGNDGPNCGSGAYPGSSHLAIAVGSTTITESLSGFSSKGPVKGLIKPDISGPGENVRSAYIRGDDDYVNLSGTSMSTPAVAGVIALMLSKNPDLTFEEIKSALFSTTDKNLQNPGLHCGEIDESNFPNNAFGYGRVNALNAFNVINAKINILKKF